MATFPAIRPTRRSFTFGEYPVKAYRALSGKVVRRSFGSKPYGHLLELMFEGIDDNVVNQLFDHYNIQQGVTIGFTLPDEVFSGISSELRGKLQAPSSIEWIYAETPTVESIYSGRSNVTIKLTGEFA
jgi:hypothetical protein